MRKCFLVIILFPVLIFSLHANLYIVNLDELPQDNQFKIRLEQLINIDQYVNHYSPTWNYPQDKNDFILFLEDFHQYNIGLYETYESYNLRLLNAVILSYLYNLNAASYSNKLIEEVDYLKEHYPNHYQTNWLYGNYLLNSAKPLEGYKEFAEIMNTDNDLNNYPLEFIHNYSYACIMVRMYKNALYSYEIGSVKDKDILNYRLYHVIKELFLEPDIESEYPYQEVWNVFISDEQPYLLSRMFGSLIPLKNTWNLQLINYQKKRGFFFFKPDKFVSNDGEDITITVLFEYNLEDLSYIEFQEQKIESLPIIKEEKRIINGREFDVYQFEDLTKYQHIGGSRGYYIMTSLDRTEYPGINIERPRNIERQENIPVQYFPLEKELDRVYGKINIGILVDSCNDIFEDTGKFIFDFLNACVFE
ncbi:hypothetical protein [Breznakiella homolactica]|uniref:Uncharacterized protein n=1 Tax=Breznakiella homolactica TaxID=2798577 RepID=A0A7T7XP67_9SPIR|nr:hypothetical protein [Breznakiella homolactica]QQO09931.1 hypothetical protein JFL75_03190 [Breznakiella homolactica]